MPVGLEKTSESPLDSKEIKPVNLQGDQPWLFTGRIDAEAEAPVFWSSDANRSLIGKVLMLGKIKGRRRREYQRMRWLEGITNAINMNLGKLQEMVRDSESWCVAVHGVTKNQTWLGDWTTTPTITYISAYDLYKYLKIGHYCYSCGCYYRSLKSELTIFNYDFSMD